MKEFIDKTSEQSGTPINRANLMAMQGFIANNIVIENGNLIQTNKDGESLIVQMADDGSIIEIFNGTKTIKRKTKATIGRLEVTIE